MTNTDLSAANRLLRVRVVELEDRLDAVENLHRLCTHHGAKWCITCTQDPARPVAWPCDTVLTARGDTIT